jgi:hypothetical protein
MESDIMAETIKSAIEPPAMPSTLKATGSAISPGTQGAKQPAIIHHPAGNFESRNAS